jgi:hypothetical protein
MTVIAPAAVDHATGRLLLHQQYEIRERADQQQHDAAEEQPIDATVTAIPIDRGDAVAAMATVAARGNAMARLATGYATRRGLSRPTDRRTGSAQAELRGPWNPAICPQSGRRIALPWPCALPSLSQTLTRCGLHLH